MPEPEPVSPLAAMQKFITLYRYLRSCSRAVQDYGVRGRAVTQRSLRRQMGIVPQDPFLFSGSLAAHGAHAE